MDLSLVDKITKNQLRNDIPEFKSGDTVKVHVRIKEGNKTRIQIFEGVVLMAVLVLHSQFVRFLVV